MEAEVKRPNVIIEAIVTRADGTIEDLGIIAREENIEVLKKEEVKDNG